MLALIVQVTQYPHMSKNNKIECKWLARDAVAFTLYPAPVPYNPHICKQELKQLYQGHRIRYLRPLCVPEDRPEGESAIWTFETAPTLFGERSLCYCVVGMPPVFMSGKIYDDEFPSGRKISDEEWLKLKPNLDRRPTR